MYSSLETAADFWVSVLWLKDGKYKWVQGAGGDLPVAVWDEGFQAVLCSWHIWEAHGESITWHASWISNTHKAPTSLSIYSLKILSTSSAYWTRHEFWWYKCWLEVIMFACLTPWCVGFECFGGGWVCCNTQKQHRHTWLNKLRGNENRNREVTVTPGESQYGG